MINRVGNHMQRRQRDQKASTNDSNLTTTIDLNAHLQSDSTFSEPQTSSVFETGALDGGGSFSLELEDLWNMLISSNSRITQDFAATEEATTLYNVDHDVP